MTTPKNATRISRWAKRFAAMLALLALSLAALAWAALDRQPLVQRDISLSPDAIVQTKRLLAANDPRRMQRGEQRRLSIPANLIDEAINYAASRFLNGRGAFTLSPASGEARLTLHAPGPAASFFINLRATVDAGNDEPRIASARIGSLPVPAFVANAIIDQWVRAAGREREWTLARSAIRGIAFDPARQLALVDYTWEPALLESARQIAFVPEDIARLRDAQTRFAQILAQASPTDTVALSSVLKPMLAAAGSSFEQRRAALFVVGIFLAERSLSALLPEARNWPRPPFRTITLNGRYDSAQHFVISATLTTWADTPAAQAIGLAKELHDARRGYGFSFADLAVDKAGTRFGQLVAAGSGELDTLLQQGMKDEDLSPLLDGLPEYLAERELRQRFGDPDSAAWQQMAADIEHRVDALPLYAGSR